MTRRSTRARGAPPASLHDRDVAGGSAVTTLRAMGIRLVVPPGWDASITREADPDDGAAEDSSEVRCPFVHVASIAMPRYRGHYGAGVVELLGPTDAFAALVEFDHASVGTRLFSRRGLIANLPASAFAPTSLQRPLRGQLGYQAFFEESGRAFCLYAVLGGGAARRATLPDLRGILASVSIGRLEGAR